MPDASGCEQSPCGCALQQGARAAALAPPPPSLLSTHVTQGKHRTGCLIGCYRGVCGWAYSAIFEEYRRHAGAAPMFTSLPPAHLPHSSTPCSGTKFRRSDQLFIELFVRKYPRILVRGEFLPQFPSAACTAAVYPSKTPPSSPPQHSLQGDGQLDP
jgi:hypothetical protein